MLTTRFALAPITHRKFGVTSRSQVLFDGKPTGLIIEGSTLQRQHETYSGFLLWATYDEQLASISYASLQIYLVSSAITILDVRSISSGQLGAAQLEHLFKTGDDVFQFTFQDRWRLNVRREPRFQIIRRAYEWGEQSASSVHHTAFFAHRYLELERVRPRLP